MDNTELNDLGFFLVFVERISVYKFIENLVEHGRFVHQVFNDLYYLPCFYPNDVIDLLP